MGPSNVDELLATTLSDYHDELVDNIYVAIPTLRELKKKGRKTKGSGISIVYPLEYRKNTTAKFYSDDDVLDTTRQNNYTSAQYLWKQLSVTVSITGLEATINSGSEAVIDLIKSRLTSAENSGMEQLSSAIFAASPTTKELISLPTLIDATSNIGDIDSSTNSWWQSQVTTSGSFAAQGLSDMRHTYNLCSQFSEMDIPDLMTTTQAVHEYYEGMLQHQERYASAEEVDAGIKRLVFKGKPVVWDPKCTSGVMYFLNSKHLELRIAKDFISDGWVRPDNQDIKVTHLLWYGAFVSDERRKQGKMTTISA
jgi:hypothetical protein